MYMLYLKKINLEDVDKEYDAIKKMPKFENGFENEYYDCTKESLKNEIIPTLKNNEMGKDLKEGYVPQTYYFLWDDDRIVGLFKFRHYLNDFLKTGPGHIGYTILSNERGKGYATKGLKLLIDEVKDIVPEDELYFSVWKENPASLKVMQNCGAHIVGESKDNKEYLTRIYIKNIKKN